MLKLFSGPGLGGGFCGGEVVAGVRRCFALELRHCEKIATFAIFSAKALSRLCLSSNTGRISDHEVHIDLDQILIELGIAVSDDSGLGFFEEPMVELRNHPGLSSIAPRIQDHEAKVRKELLRINGAGRSKSNREVSAAVCFYANSVISLYDSITSDATQSKALSWIFRSYSDLFNLRSLLIEDQLRGDLDHNRALNEKS